MSLIIRTLDLRRSWPAVRSPSFISKKENESIPLLGRWAQLIGTIH
ncbi:MAG: hypothetical protein ACLVJ6_11950 [Merdibacter sp.]